MSDDEKDKPACGKVVKLVEASSSAEGAQSNAHSLDNMTEAEADEYMAALAGGAVELTGLEVTINEQLQQAAQRRLKAEQRMGQIRQELDELSKVAVAAQGEVDGHIKLLMFAEDGRRGNPPKEGDS